MNSKPEQFDALGAIDAALKHEIARREQTEAALLEANKELDRRLLDRIFTVVQCDEAMKRLRMCRPRPAAARLHSHKWFDVSTRCG